MKKVNADEVTEIQAKANREPTDTSLEATKFMNDFFKKKFGIALRSETVFSTPERSIARSYGTDFCIIPSNGYTMYQHPKILDFFRNI